MPVCESESLRFRETICREVCRTCVEAFGSRLRSIVLTGSVARDEGTFHPETGGFRLLGDVEFLVVFQDGSSLPVADEMLDTERAVERTLLLRYRLRCSLDLDATSAAFFRKAEPTTFTYELRVNGKVVWGEDMLALMAPFLASEIPLEDAFRTLCNRTIELLGTMDGTHEATDVQYAAAKLLLDMNTSVLLFAGEYAPSYAARQMQLDVLAKSRTDTHRWPFCLLEFAQVVGRCTDWKLHGVVPGEPLLEEALSRLRPLWHWELQRLGFGAEGAMKQWARWRRSQALTARVRGWLFAVRAVGLASAIRELPTWTRKSLGGSPRAWIYGAAAELAFAWEPGKSIDEVEFRMWLPLRSRTGEQKPAALLFENYKRLLVETRA